MLNRTFVFALLLLLTGLSAVSSHAAVISVDPSRVYQRIEGFGVSGCWWAQRTDRWPRKLLAHALDLLFTPQGADLSIYRYNIGASGGSEIPWPSRRAACVEVSPGIYNLARDRVAINVLDEVRRRGVTDIIATSNSPPIRLTRNGMASGGDNGGPNLRSGAEAQYAKYLVDITDLIRRREGLKRMALSPINEPQWHWGSDKRTQEGCYYSPEQTRTVIKAVVNEIASRHLPLDTEAPDLGQWGGESLNYVRSLLDSSAINAHLQTLSVHSYFSESADKPPLAQLVHQLNPRLPIGMTEFCQMERGRHLDMDAALEMVQVLYDDFTLGNISSWDWWLAVSRSNFADGLIYLDPDGQTLIASKRLDVVGQFSRFVRPGAVRIAATCDQADLKVLAFLSADKSHIIIVVINSAETAIPISLPPPRGFDLKEEFVTDAKRQIVALPINAPILCPRRAVMTIIHGLSH